MMLRQLTDSPNITEAAHSQLHQLTNATPAPLLLIRLTPSHHSQAQTADCLAPSSPIP